MNKKITVFCGSRLGSDYTYKEAAYRTGLAIAERQCTLIYGGGIRGLMGSVSSGTLDAGGKVIGYFPRFLEDIEVPNRQGVELIYVKTMDERKVLMYGYSDACIVLPGGFGTMDEFFEVLTLRQIGQFDKPIGILNIDGYYDPLIEALHSMVEKGFVEVEHMELFYVRENIDDLLDVMGF